MLISESRQQAPNTILTKCSKMTTEERHRRHGMNGSATTADNGVPKEDCPKAVAQGGRLKFFKDGKFILELERAREGERVSWVSVPRKTFWPPPGIAVSTPAYRQESSTSLSVSDDNSSIQSSPWQRDHSWKQTSPRRNLSREMSFFFWHPPGRSRPCRRSRKRRRPYSTAPEELKVWCGGGGGNGGSGCSDLGVERTAPLPKDSVCNNRPTFRRRMTSRHGHLLVVVQALLERGGAGTTAGTPPLPRAEVVVSPRKRFLREMEKDNKVQGLEDGCQKRSRNRTPQQQQLAAPQPQQIVQAATAAAVPLVSSVKVGSPVAVRVNGTASALAIKEEPPQAAAAGGFFLGIKEEPRSVVVTPPAPSSNAPGVGAAAAPKPSRNCSYSITSLLAEDRNVHRSPNNSPSHFSPVVKTEDRWYSESVDRLRSIELSQVDKRNYPQYPHHSYLPYMYHQYSLPPFYNPNMYGRGYMVPPVYPPPPMQLALRHDSPSSSWVMESTEDPMKQENRDESISDMPLNLSKHAG